VRCIRYRRFSLPPNAKADDYAKFDINSPAFDLVLEIVPLKDATSPTAHVAWRLHPVHLNITEAKARVAPSSHGTNTLKLDVAVKIDGVGGSGSADPSSDSASTDNASTAPDDPPAATKGKTPSKPTKPPKPLKPTGDTTKTSAGTILQADLTAPAAVLPTGGYPAAALDIDTKIAKMYCDSTPAKYINFRPGESQANGLTNFEAAEGTPIPETGTTAPTCQLHMANVLNDSSWFPSPALPPTLKKPIDGDQGYLAPFTVTLSVTEGGLDPYAQKRIDDMLSGEKSNLGNLLKALVPSSGKGGSGG
jgi:hypothetical protein